MSQPLPFAITICGLRELLLHAEGGFDHVLSLIDPEEPDPSDLLSRYAPHHWTLLRFHDTVAERAEQVPPNERHIAAILDFGTRMRANGGQRLLVHCHAGVSRSTAAAAILLAQYCPGEEHAAFAAVRAARPRSWPNSRLIAMADATLMRNGALIAAMREHHDLVARQDLALVRLIRTVGRGHEIPGQEAQQ
jgi:predicted protein tyrosine phosphatase